MADIALKLVAFAELHKDEIREYLIGRDELHLEDINFVTFADGIFTYEDQDGYKVTFTVEELKGLFATAPEA